MSEIKALSDKNIVPSDELVQSIIGERMSLWQEFVDKAKTDYEGSEGGWNYYNDGKQWLFKFVRKKKTLFWAGIFENTIRVSFWFGDKAEPYIKGSDLSNKLKADFNVSKKYGAIRALSIVMNDREDLLNALKLLEIKSKLK